MHTNKHELGSYTDYTDSFLAAHQYHRTHCERQLVTRHSSLVTYPFPSVVKKL